MALHFHSSTNLAQFKSSAIKKISNSKKSQPVWVATAIKNTGNSKQSHPVWVAIASKSKAEFMVKSTWQPAVFAKRKNDNTPPSFLLVVDAFTDPSRC